MIDLYTSRMFGQADEARGGFCLGRGIGASREAGDDSGADESGRDQSRIFTSGQPERQGAGPQGSEAGTRPLDAVSSESEIDGDVGGGSFGHQFVSRLGCCGAQIPSPALSLPAVDDSACGDLLHTYDR
jgi:hypothetical protein